MADFRPADDETILPDEVLYIRIPPGEDSCKAVEGGYRPTSGGIKHYPEEPVSCDLSSICTPGDTRTRGTNGQFHVAAISVGVLRDLGFRVVQDPVHDGPHPNPAHALILGTRVDGNKDLRGALTHKQFSKIAHAARIVMFAPGAEPDHGAAMRHETREGNS
jgi:hypothetical protein